MNEVFGYFQVGARHQFLRVGKLMLQRSKRDQNVSNVKEDGSITLTVAFLNATDATKCKISTIWKELINALMRISI